MKRESTDDVRVRCMLESDGTLYLNEKDRANVRKEHMSKIRNEENEWCHIADADTVDGPIERVVSVEIMKSFSYLIIKEVPEPSEYYAIMIIACWDVGIIADITLQANTAMLEYWIILEQEWQTTGQPVLQFLFLKQMNMSWTVTWIWVLKLLEHAMKTVEKVFVKWLRKICNNRWYAIRLYAK